MILAMIQVVDPSPYNVHVHYQLLSPPGLCLVCSQTSLNALTRILPEGSKGWVSAHQFYPIHMY